MVSVVSGAVDKAVIKVLDHGSKLQAPAVAAYVNHLRKSHPDETPEKIIERLEGLFLLGVTGSGGAVGAAAALPGVGTLASLGAISAETAFFLEASALFTLAVAHVHGVNPLDNEHRRALVIAVALGDTGMGIVERAAGHSAKNWGTVLGTKLPGIGDVNDSLIKKFIFNFFKKRALLMFGKIIPAGIGAAVGAIGNRALAKTIIENAHTAFGPAPTRFPEPMIVDAEVVSNNAATGPAITEP
ncbi:hypothetical protein [Smaragdicoccus niigatensis]|uniref:hypothetical protein n=1 Tax=Smaragdicoccus niigatensis TaxID=359359 RepID=UPI000377CB74|nr:hypothetical protein [Smaragdicoccus niigatensis]